MLFVDSADKAARFIWLCDAFNVPLLYLADVPGLHGRHRVERQGIIRRGAKMISAVSEATVPKICVVVRKAYGAGLYAMAGPGFEPDATLALPTAQIAVMGPRRRSTRSTTTSSPRIADPGEEGAGDAAAAGGYDNDIDVLRLAGELVVDNVVEPEELRAELAPQVCRGAWQGPSRSPAAGTASRPL